MIQLSTKGLPIYLLKTTLPNAIVSDDDIIILRKKNNATFLALFLGLFYVEEKTGLRSWSWEMVFLTI
jgi:hypothetical protein